MTISECSFSETSGNGGALLYLDSYNNHMVISDSTFTSTSNGAFKSGGSDDDGDAFYGGAIFLNNYNKYTEMYDCTFRDSFASFGGGALFLGFENIDTEISRCSFIRNSATTNGVGPSVWILETISL